MKINIKQKIISWLGCVTKDEYEQSQTKLFKKLENNNGNLRREINHIHNAINSNLITSKDYFRLEKKIWDITPKNKKPEKYIPSRVVYKIIEKL